MLEVYASWLLVPEREKARPFLEFAGCAACDEPPRRAGGRGSPIRDCASPLSLGQWKSADSGRQVRAVSGRWLSHSAKGGRAGSKVWGNPVTGFKVKLRCFAQEVGDGIRRDAAFLGTSVALDQHLEIERFAGQTLERVIARKPSSSTSRSSRSSRSTSPSRLRSHRATRARCGQVSRLRRPHYRRQARRGSFVTSPARGPQSCWQRRS